MMKKLVVILALMFLLSGCTEDVFETIGDQNDVVVMATPAAVLVDLPSSAASPVMEGAYGKLYFCDGYELAIETHQAGDLNATLRNLTGFGKDELQLIQTLRCGVPCYESTWCAAGDTGDQVGRIMVLDDGNYHYCISFMADADEAAACTAEWQSVLDSLALAEN